MPLLISILFWNLKYVPKCLRIKNSAIIFQSWKSSSNNLFTQEHRILVILFLNSKFSKSPFSQPLQTVLCLVFVFFPRQMKFFDILYITSIVLQWKLPIADIPNSGHPLNSGQYFQSKYDGQFFFKNGRCALFRGFTVLWNLVINKRCITLEIAKDLNNLSLPFKVNCIIRHKFNIFSILTICSENFLSSSRFYYTKNEHQVFSRFRY